MELIDSGKRTQLYTHTTIRNTHCDLVAGKNMYGI